MLAPLRAYDDKHQTELERTLRLYFAESGRTSRQLRTTQRPPAHRLLPSAPDRAKSRAARSKAPRSTHSSPSDCDRCTPLPMNRDAPQNKRDASNSPRSATCVSCAWCSPTSSASARTSPFRSTELEAAFDGRVTFDGGSIDGFVRGEELDMVLRPDPATFALYPWSRDDAGEARLICNIAMPDGSPFEGCPRTTLQRADRRHRASDCRDLRIGLESEFYLFERRETAFGSTETSDVGSYFDFSANDRGEDGAQRDRRGTAVDGNSRRFGAPRARRGATRDRSSRTKIRSRQPTTC